MTASVILSPATPSIGGGGGLLRSTDFGETWDPVAQFAGLDCWGVAIGVRNSNVIFVGTYKAAKSQFSTFISTDRGNSWTPVTCGLTSFLNYGALVLDSLTMFVLQGDGVYRFEMIDLQQQPMSFIGGTIFDTASGRPLAADLVLRYDICDSMYTRSMHADSSGAFSFAQLPVSSSPFISDYQLDADPELPFATLKVSSLHLDTSSIALAIRPRRADLLIAGDRSATLDVMTLENMAGALNGGVHLFITGQNILEYSDTAHVFRNLLGVGFERNIAYTYVQGKGGDLMDNLGYFTRAAGSSSQDSVLHRSVPRKREGR